VAISVKLVLLALLVGACGCGLDHRRCLGRAVDGLEDKRQRPLGIQGLIGVVEEACPSRNAADYRRAFL
jgi:hypothetical protein